MTDHTASPHHNAPRRASRRRHFRSRRGRPRARQAIHNEPDPGTPELLTKRRYHLTTEPIDLCLNRKLIDETQHRNALRFRWLYTIRFGAPGVSAFDYARAAGKDLFVEDDPAWRAAREQDYRNACDLLRKLGAHRLVFHCVIYNEPPDFLDLSRLAQGMHQPNALHSMEKQLQLFQLALEQLGTLMSD